MRFFKRKKKKGNSLPLNHVYTFLSGEKLYTYRSEDLGKASSRYYRNIQEASNYLQTFALTKNEWEESIKKCKEMSVSALASNNSKQLVETLMDINSTFDWFIDKASGLKGAQEAIFELTFCMLYLLEDEIETGYSEIHNKRKIELLNAEPDARDFFLTKLKEDTEGWLITLRSDTLKLLRKLDQMQGGMMFLNMPKT